MFCTNCGKEIDEGVAFCPHCGAQIKKPAEAQPGNQTQSNSNSTQKNPAPSNSAKSNPPAEKTTCDLAIVGFVLSFFIAIAGLVVSIIGYRKCKNENLGGQGFATAGIIISAIGLAGSVIGGLSIGLVTCLPLFMI